MPKGCDTKAGMIEQSTLLAWWAPALAFAAGVVSCASPCILPVIPGYVSFVSGTALGPRSPSGGAGAVAVAEIEVRAGRRTALWSMLLFVLGFATVFTALGAFSRVFVPIFRSELGYRIAGIVVILIGTAMILYAFRIGGRLLLTERRPFLSKIRPGPKSAYPLGMAFAAGCTPCIGPVLAGMLGVAGVQGGGAWGAVLMASYSLGLGVPFVALGLGVNRLVGAFGFLKRNYHWFSGVGGALLVFIGVLLALNLWTLFLARIGLLNLIRGFTPPL